MFYFYKLLKSLILPPGIFVILFVIAALSVRKGFLRWLFWMSAILTYLLSIYPTTIFLRRIVVPRVDYSLSAIDVVVVMGGGLTDESISRLVKGKEIHDLTGAPVIITGYNEEASMMKNKLLSIGLDSSYLIVDRGSRNTFESIRNVMEIIRDRGFEKVAVVSTDYHLRRVMMEFGKYGMNVIPIPSNPRRSRIRNILDFFPSMAVFYTNYIYVKELIGIVAFYSIR